MFTTVLFAVAILALSGFVFFLTKYFSVRCDLDLEKSKHCETMKWLHVAQADVNFRKEKMEELRALLAIKELDLATAIKESNDVNYKFGKFESENIELKQTNIVLTKTVEAATVALNEDLSNIRTVTLPKMNFTSEDCSRIRDYFNNTYPNTNLTFTFNMFNESSNNLDEPYTIIEIDGGDRLDTPLKEVDRWCRLIRIVLHVLQFRVTSL